MSELIDRQDVIDRLKKAEDVFRQNGAKLEANGIHYALELVESDIEIPTIDACNSEYVKELKENMETKLSIAYLKGRRQGQSENTKMQYQIEVNGVPIEKLGLSSVTVEERPQGKWIFNKYTGDIICSCCRQSRRDTRTNHIFFCNHCGAKMEKKEADNEQ